MGILENSAIVAVTAPAKATTGPKKRSPKTKHPIKQARLPSKLFAVLNNFLLPYGIPTSAANVSPIARNESEATAQVTVVRSVGIDENENIEGIKIYPNPTNGIVHVESESSIQKIQVFNSSGQSMMVYESPKNTYSAFKHSHEFNTSDWTPGIYMIQISDGKGGWKTEKLIVQ